MYWMIEMGEKMALMGGILTGVLMWGTGQWDRGVRWPRRWVGIANRGLRSVNAKIVVIKGPWYKELLGHLAFLFPYTSFFPSNGPSYHYIDPSEKQGYEDLEDTSPEEDLSPGGDYIKVLLLSKPFSPDFRENWELYRLEYWEKENERRARLRQALRKRERELAQKKSPWFWWVGWRVKRRHLGISGKPDVEKSHHKHHHHEKDGKRQSTLRSESHSRTASRSSTPSTLDPDDRPTVARSRRGSASTASASERRRKAKQGSSIEHSHITKMTPVSRPA